MRDANKIWHGTVTHISVLIQFDDSRISACGKEIPAKLPGGPGFMDEHMDGVSHARVRRGGIDIGR